MNLGGWDTMSAAAMPLINVSLADMTKSTATSFSFKEGAVQVAGNFGPWQIVDGGSSQLLHLSIPVADGTLTGLGADPVPLDGIRLVMEVALRLLPNEANDEVELGFSFEAATESAGPAIQMLHLVDPNERFPYIGNAVVMSALSQALNANLDGVAFVLARLKTRGSVEDWLRTPFVDWANVRLGDGRHYLALFGALREPRAAMRLDKIDPELFHGKGSAYFAASHAIFYQNLLQPHLQKHFRPKTSFTASASKVQSGSYVIAHRAEHGGPMVGEPEIFKDVGDFFVKAGNDIGKFVDKTATDIAKGVEKVVKDIGDVPINMIQKVTVQETTFTCQGNKLVCKANVQAMLPSAILQLDVVLNMPFIFEKKTGAISFSRDSTPSITHKILPRKDVDIIAKSLGFGVTTIVIELAKKTIYGTIANITSNMQKLNTPTKVPASWIGLRDFEASAAKLDRCFWFRDDRSV